MVVELDENEIDLLKELYASSQPAKLRGTKAIGTLMKKGLIEYVDQQNQLTRYGEQFTAKLLKSLGVLA